MLLHFGIRRPIHYYSPPLAAWVSPLVAIGAVLGLDVWIRTMLVGPVLWLLVVVVVVVPVPLLPSLPALSSAS